MAVLWGGRFTKETDDKVFNFNESLSFDKRLYAVDINGSKCHAKMLGKQGIITERENKLYESVTKPWFDAAELKIETGVWSKVGFDRIMQMAMPTEEAN